MNDTSNAEQEILAVLDRHLKSIWTGDLATYRATTGGDVTFYEWYISTQRIDGIDFHLRETAANFRAAEARRQAGQRYEVEHEVLTPKVQLYGEIAILSYTLLMRYTSDAGVRHTEHNETRVFHRRPDGWQLVHCHKSPMWPAPHAPVCDGAAIEIENGDVALPARRDETTPVTSSEESG